MSSIATSRDRVSGARRVGDGAALNVFALLPHRTSCTAMQPPDRDSPPPTTAGPLCCPLQVAAVSTKVNWTRKRVRKLWATMALLFYEHDCRGVQQTKASMICYYEQLTDGMRSCDPHVIWMSWGEICCSSASFGMARGKAGSPAWE
ncbi:hypothetical protein B296_00053079 [Ensete ventricosum]|uniref:Uncharacterized protein n=1 Tax=Ensete ventricosum TaxID=4639 RepID=A0A426Y9R2_ENSVE|nr:hypothetical protein B296_00053079 [Ensete ventricosum]